MTYRDREILRAEARVKKCEAIVEEMKKALDDAKLADQDHLDFRQSEVELAELWLARTQAAKARVALTESKAPTATV